MTNPVSSVVREIIDLIESTSVLPENMTRIVLKPVYVNDEIAFITIKYFEQGDEEMAFSVIDSTQPSPTLYDEQRAHMISLTTELFTELGGDISIGYNEGKAPDPGGYTTEEFDIQVWFGEKVIEISLTENGGVLTEAPIIGGSSLIDRLKFIVETTKLIRDLRNENRVVREGLDFVEMDRMATITYQYGDIKNSQINYNFGGYAGFEELYFSSSEHKVLLDSIRKDVLEGIEDGTFILKGEYEPTDYLSNTIEGVGSTKRYSHKIFAGFLDLTLVQCQHPQYGYIEYFMLSAYFEDIKKILNNEIKFLPTSKIF